jgi:hypothetical protein
MTFLFLFLSNCYASICSAAISTALMLAVFLPAAVAKNG